MKGIVNVCLVLLCGSLFANSNSTRIDFINGSLGLAIEKAGQEGKLLFVEFGAQWCMPCRFMEENTFRDKQVVDYMSENYVPVKIDIDDFDGFAYKQQYNVEALPTFIIFDSQGKVVERYEQSMAPSNLLNILKVHNIPNNRQLVNTVLNSYEIEAQLHEAKKKKYNISPYEAQEISESETSNSQSESNPDEHLGNSNNWQSIEITKEQEIPNIELQSSLTPTITMSDEFIWSEDESYDLVENTSLNIELSSNEEEELVNFEEPVITFYTIQVGSFANERSKDEFVKATSAIFLEDTHIFENRYQEQTTYEVCIGAFVSEKSASAYLGRLNLLNIEGKIKSVEQ